MKRITNINCNYITFFVIFLFLNSLSGCLNQEAREKKIKVAAEADSISKVEQLIAIETQRQADSIRSALVKKAYMSANFGMTSKEVSQLDDFKEWYSYGHREKIGTLYYDIELHYNNDSLYLVQISTSYQSASSLSKYIPREIENLKDIFMYSYGEPTINNGIPSIFELSPGYLSRAYEWRIDTKRIFIGIYEIPRGSQYRTIAEIYDEPTYTRIRNQRKNEEERKRSNDANKL